MILGRAWIGFKTLDVNYRGKRLGYLYVADDGFLRYKRTRQNLPLLTPEECRHFQNLQDTRWPANAKSAAPNC